MRRFILMFMIILLSACGQKTDLDRKNPIHMNAEGSDEVWYWPEDHTSFIDEGILYTPSANNTQLIVYDLKNDNKDELPLNDGVVIQSVSKLDNGEVVAALYDKDSSNTSLAIVDFEKKMFEEVVDVQGLVVFMGNTAYWHEGCKLKQYDFTAKEVSSLADFSAVESNGERISLRDIGGGYIALERTIIGGNNSDLIVVNLENGEWEYIVVDAHQLIEGLGSNTFMIGMNEEGMYFWACSSKEEYHIKTDFHGQHAEVVMKNPDFRYAAPDSPVSQNGRYYASFSASEKMELDELKMVLMNWKDGETRFVSELSDATEVRCYPLQGFIKCITFRSDGLQEIYLIQPETGDRWEIDCGKIEYYLNRELEALEGVSKPVEILNQHSGKKSEPDEAGEGIVLENAAVSLKNIPDSELINYSQIGYQDESGTVWAVSYRERWNNTLYRLNDSNELVLGFTCAQFGTWNEQSVSLVPTSKGLMMRYYYCTDMGNYINYYVLNDQRAELYVGGLQGEANEIILTENGAFVAVSSDFDPEVALEHHSLEEYDSFVTVYYYDLAGNQYKLCRLEGTDAEMAYDASEKSLLLKESDWMTNDKHTYILDLKTLKLKQLN